MLVTILVTAKPMASADASLSAKVDQSAEFTPAGTCNSFTQHSAVRQNYYNCKDIMEKNKKCSF